MKQPPNYGSISLSCWDAECWLLAVGCWLLVVVAAAGLGKLPHGEPSDGLPNFQLNDFTKVGGTIWPRWRALNILRHLNAFYKFFCCNL